MFKKLTSKSFELEIEIALEKHLKKHYKEILKKHPDVSKEMLDEMFKEIYTLGFNDAIIWILKNAEQKNNALFDILLESHPGW